MGAGTSVQFRLLAAALTAILLSPFFGGADRSIGFSPPHTTTIPAASEGGRSFSPAVHSRAPVDVRALAARGPTDAPIGGTVPFLPLPSQATPSPSAPSPQVYSGPAPVQATITGNPAAAQSGFQGLSTASGPDTNYDPPDPWVAVGPNDVVQAVNSSLRFTDRLGNSPVAVSLGTFFGTGGLPVADPRVIYDSLHGRWIATAFAWDCDAGNGASYGHGYLLTGISDTSDPLGTWSGFYFVYPDHMPDFPAPGTSSDKVAFTANVFAMSSALNCLSGAGYVGSDILVMDWTAILNITTLPFEEYATGANYFTPRVAVQTPATSAPLRMVIQKLVSGSLDVAYWTITGLVGPSGTGTTATEVDLTAANVIQDFLDPIAPRQPAGAFPSTMIDSRPTDAIWQNNKLTFVSTQACTPTGDSETRDCVRVSRLNTSTSTPSLAQDFLIAQSGEDSYMGGIGTSRNGALFVVWTRSSGTAGHYPSSYAAYNLPTDAPNSISAPELLAAGQTNYSGVRWGDYVGVAQDPQDPTAVWQGNEYASSDGWWGTFVSQLRTTGSTFVPLTPARLLDSRYGNGLSGPFSAEVPRTFQVRGRGGVPADATAVTGNLTVTNQSQPGYVYLGPDPTASPTSSTLNFPLADNRANGVTVALSPSGSLSAVYMAAAGGTTDLVFDVTGYFVPDDSGATFVPLTPARLLDTRVGNGLSGAFSAGVPRTFQVRGRGEVPADATAVTGNLTVTNQTQPGYVFLGPDPVASPTSSTLNFPLGDNRANGVTVALSGFGTLAWTPTATTGGDLSATYMASPGTTDLVFDVTGYFVP